MVTSVMRGRLSAVVLATVAIVSGGALSGQGIRPVSVNVDGGRPLKSATERVERQLGRTVTYEEGPWLYSGDYIDITESVQKVSDPKKLRTFVPRGGPFTFTHSFAADKAASPLELVKALLDDYRQTDYPGVFEIAQTGDVLHVVRVMAKNAEGKLERQQPLLDAPITPIDRDMSAASMTEAIVEDVRRVTGANVVSGTLPDNLFLRTRVRGPMAGETARTALVRMIQATGRRLSWQLMCDGGPRDAPKPLCALNFYAVEFGSGAQ